MWTDPTNDQALHIYDVFGTIPVPSEHDVFMMSNTLNMSRIILETQSLEELNKKFNLHNVQSSVSDEKDHSLNKLHITADESK